MILELFTDGSSILNDKVKASAAAYAVYIKDILVKDGTEFFDKGTNNLAESSAILLGMNKINKMIKKVDKKYIKHPIHIHVYSDSLITVDTCRDWIYRWMKRSRNGILKNSNGQDVANQDIFKEIYKKYLINDNYKISFYHVNSHTIDHYSYSNYMDEIINYFQNRHRKKKIKLNVPKELFTNEKFRKAKEKFKKVNNIDITNEELLRIMVYNKYVDELASECLYEGISKLAI